MSILNKPKRMFGTIFDSLHSFYVPGANGGFFADMTPEPLVVRLYPKTTLRRFAHWCAIPAGPPFRRYYRNRDFLGPI
jgi:hypothetical protein